MDRWLSASILIPLIVCCSCNCKPKESGDTEDDIVVGTNGGAGTFTVTSSDINQTITLLDPDLALSGTCTVAYDSLTLTVDAVSHEIETELDCIASGSWTAAIHGLPVGTHDLALIPASSVGPGPVVAFNVSVAPVARFFVSPSDGFTRGRSLIEHSSGDIFLAGMSDSEIDLDPSDTDVLVDPSPDGLFFAVYDKNFVLKKSAAIAGDAEILFSMELNNGNYLILGKFVGVIDFNPDAAASETADGLAGTSVFFLIMDSDLAFVSLKTIIGNNNSTVWLGAPSQTTTTITIPGYFRSGPADDIDIDISTGIDLHNSTAGLWDSFLIRLDERGIYMSHEVFTDAGNVLFTALATDTSSNTIICGYFSGADNEFGLGAAAALSSAGGNDAMVIKLDQNDGFLWSRSISGNDAESACLRVGTNQEGDIFIMTRLKASLADFAPGLEGGEHDRLGVVDIGFARYSANGDLVWSRTIGGPGASVYIKDGFVADGSIVAAGFMQNGGADFDPASDLDRSLAVADRIQLGYLIMLDPSGQLQWLNSVYGNATGGMAAAVSVTTSGASSFLLSGYASSPFHSMTWQTPSL